MIVIYKDLLSLIDLIVKAHLIILKDGLKFNHAMIIHAVKIFNLMKTNHLFSKFKNNKLKMKIKFHQNIAFMEF